MNFENNFENYSNYINDNNLIFQIKNYIGQKKNLKVFIIIKNVP